MKYLKLLVITDAGMSARSSNGITFSASGSTEAIAGMIMAGGLEGLVFAGVTTRDPIEQAYLIRSQPEFAGIPIIVLNSVDEFLNGTTSLSLQHIRGHTMRNGAGDPRIITVDEPARQTVTGGIQTNYSPLEIRLLLFLMRHPDVIFSRNELWDRISRNGHSNGRMIDALVLRLRKKLEIDRTIPVHLKTIRSIGYVFHYGETTFIDRLTKERFRTWPCCSSELPQGNPWTRHRAC